MDLTEFLGEFQLEAGEKLDAIASQLLRLERDASNPQPVREMFLAAHTIKGGAAMMRLTEVETLAHALEDLLCSLRDRQRTLDGPTADVLFQAIDRLRVLIAEASSTSVGREADAQLLEFAARLRAGECEVVATTLEVRRALVVDDSATVRELYRMLLEDAGYDVETCQDAAAALARAKQFELILAGMRYQELAVAMKAVRVVLMSADPDAQIETGAHALIRRGSLRDGAQSLSVAAFD